MTSPDADAALHAKLTQMTRDRFTGRLAGVVAGLRDLADQVERLVDNSDRDPTYIATAASVHAAILWRLPNLHLDGLVVAASEADELRRGSGS